MRAALFKKNLTGPDGLRAQLLALSALPDDTRKKAKHMKKDEIIHELMHFHKEKSNTAPMSSFFKPVPCNPGSSQAM